MVILCTRKVKKLLLARRKQMQMIASALYAFRTQERLYFYLAGICVSAQTVGTTFPKQEPKHAQSAEAHTKGHFSLATEVKY
jgi:hypothetical protein